MGYAVAEVVGGVRPRPRWLDAGVLRPGPVTSRSKCGRGGRLAAANARIMELGRDVAELVAEYRPAVAVVEDAAGRVNAVHGGGGVGLAVYGKAVGWIACVAAADVGELDLVDPAAWTCGRGKRARREFLVAEWPELAGLVHRSLDAADAAGLLAWWCRERAAGVER